MMIQELQTKIKSWKFSC